MKNNLMLSIAIVVSNCTMISNVFSLEYSGTCRGPTATVQEIRGIDTPHAIMTAQYTMSDAISYCHYSLNSPGDKNQPSSAAVNGCATKFMRENEQSLSKAVANCRLGTISTSRANFAMKYKFPIMPMCGDDNNQAISLFRVLCPSYKGKVDEFN